MNLNRYLYTSAHSNIIHNSRTVETSKHPLTDEWLHTMYSIHRMECYSPLKGNKIMINTTTWMNLEVITLSKTSHTKKGKY